MEVIRRDGTLDLGRWNGIVIPPTDVPDSLSTEVCLAAAARRRVEEFRQTGLMNVWLITKFSARRL